MRRKIGLLVVAVATGPLLCYGMIAYASHVLRIDSVIPLWLWVATTCVFFLGLGLLSWPKKRKEK